MDVDVKRTRYEPGSLSFVSDPNPKKPNHPGKE